MFPPMRASIPAASEFHVVLARRRKKVPRACTGYRPSGAGRLLHATVLHCFPEPGGGGGIPDSIMNRPASRAHSVCPHIRRPAVTASSFSPSTEVGWSQEMMDENQALLLHGWIVPSVDCPSLRAVGWLDSVHPYSGQPFSLEWTCSLPKAADDFTLLSGDQAGVPSSQQMYEHYSVQFWSIFLGQLGLGNVQPRRFSFRILVFTRV